MVGSKVPYAEPSQFALLADEQILAELGRRVDAYRLARRLPDKEIFARGGVTKQALAKFKKGRPISLLNFVKIMRGVGLLSTLEHSIPSEPGFSPMQQLSAKTVKAPQRVRARKSNEGAPSTNDFKWGDE